MSWDNVGSNAQSNKLGFIKIADGNNVKVRLVDEAPFIRYTHWINKLGRNITCLGKDVCPICAEIARAKAADETPQYNTSRKYVLHVIDRSDNTLKLLEGSGNMFDPLKAIQMDSDTPDLTQLDVKITRSGSGAQTKYTSFPMMASPLTPADEALMELKIDLEDKMKPMSLEALEALLNGEG